MSDDLVKRLRAIDKDIVVRRFDPEMSFDGMTAHKAADHIEKLEAALREIDTIAIRHIKGGIGKAQIIVRKALEGKDDSH